MKSLHLIIGVVIILAVMIAAVGISLAQPAPKYAYECTQTGGILYGAKSASVNSLVNAGCPISAIVNISGG